MRPNRVVSFAIVALLIVGLSVAPAGSAVVGTDSGGGATADENASQMGASVSAFMQSSAADSNASVDSGMFVAGYDRAPEDRRAAVVSQRIGSLSERYEEMEAERDRLEAAVEEYEANGEEPPSHLRAKLTKLSVRLDTFETSVNETERRATTVGVETSRLDELRTNARSLSGQAVAEIAVGLSGIDVRGGLSATIPGIGFERPTDENASRDLENVSDAVENVTDPVGNVTDSAENAAGGTGDRGPGIDDLDDSGEDSDHRSSFGR